MNRREFGHLVTALRKEHNDEYGETWIQAKLAQEANVTEAVIGSIERGTKINLESEVLLDLAKALQLTSGERNEFFAAASGIGNQFIPKEEYNSPEIVLKQLLRIMEKFSGPAFITDCFADIIALNTGCALFYKFDFNIFQETAHLATRFNIMRVFYAPEFRHQRQMMGDSWSRFAHHCLMIFRTVTLKHRANPYFSYILPELNKLPLFKQHWQNVYLLEQDHFIDNIFVDLKHPDYGDIKSVSTSITAVTSHGELKLYSVVPLDKHTTQVFFDMSKLYDNHVLLLNPEWPNRQTPFLK